MTMVELKRNTLEFVKKTLPDASKVDIETATEKIVENLTYLTKSTN